MTIQTTLTRLDRHFGPMRREDKKSGELIQEPDWSELPPEAPHEDEREMGAPVGCIPTNSVYWPMEPM